MDSQTATIKYFDMPNYLWCIMSNVTTISLDRSVVESLKKVREYPRQTYSELVGKLVKFFSEVKSRSQYDDFLHKIQQEKMRELWDNDADQEWENA